MADVIEAIHRITYEVDDSALQKVQKVIQLQIQEFNLLNKTLLDIQKQIERTGKNETAALEELSRKLDGIMGKLNANIGKTKGLMEQFGDGLLKAAGAGDGLEGIVSDFLKPFIEGLPELIGGATTIEAVAAEVFSFSNIVTGAIAILTVLGETFLSSSDDAGKLKEELKNVADNGKRVGAAAAGEMSQLFVLRATIQNVTLNYSKRNEAVSQLLKLYPEYFSKLSREEILAGRVGDAYGRIIENILANARVQVLNDNLKTSLGTLESVKDEIEKLKGTKITDKDLGLGVSLFGSVPTYNIPLDARFEGKHIDILLKKIAEYNNLANDINTTTGKIVQLQNEIDKGKPKPGGEGGLVQATPKEDAYQKERDRLDAEAEKIRVNDEQIKGIRKQRDDIEKQYTALYKSDIEAGRQITLEERNKREEDYTAAVEKLNLAEDIRNNELEQAQVKEELSLAERFKKQQDIVKLTEQLANLQSKSAELEHKQALNNVGITTEQPATQAAQQEKKYSPGKGEKFVFGKDAEIPDAEGRRRAEIKKSVDAYKSLTESAVQAFQTIYDAQVKALDAEIEIRKQRVDAAAKLAERGNTEALKQEQDRLNAVLKKREEYARRQQILNSALAVSNAIVAVAEAASETGAGAIVIVPAVIAAIVAGYAAISAATKESSAQAYADGVVDFKGKGGPRDDANWVRISSGESVITAEGTKKNRTLLEAINKGAALQFINPALAYTMPTFAQPQLSVQGYASQYDLRAVENKLDNVVNAIEDNRMKQNIYFNEHGVGLMTERAINRERKRWK
ncbi:MAG: hypothetical protein JST82_01500 [Bacteroidetes bacterium]|nr:hypothetical protein [Bacteroidota bacterium]